MKHNFVIFYAPGEITDLEVAFHIEEWDYEKALYMVPGIIEEGICVPFSFIFESREYNDFGDFCEDDTEVSCTYFLGGKIFNRSEIFDKDRFIYEKMIMNDVDRVIVNNNSSEIIKPFTYNDIILDFHV